MDRTRLLGLPLGLCHALIPFCLPFLFFQVISQANSFQVTQTLSAMMFYPSAWLHLTTHLLYGILS